jgi:glycosyltransferase involved in cell wall biosynthesis
MTAPRVSVVTIFLNGEAYLREAIESVLAQDYGDFELIMVDDGSTDGSTAIAREYAERHPGRCVYVDHPDHANRGMSASRNAGIERTRGEYVAFIDADDVWKPEKIREQVAILDAHPEVGMVAGAACYWRSWEGGSDEVVPAGHVLDRPVPPGRATTEVYPLGEAQAPCPSLLIVRRDVLDRVGGFEASYTGPLQMYEDQAFLSKVYLATHVWFSSRCWLLYRQRGDSCVSENIRLGNYDRIRRHFLDWFETYLVQHAVTDPAVWAALRRAQGADRQAASARDRSGAAAWAMRLSDIPRRLRRWVR